MEETTPSSVSESASKPAKTTASGDLDSSVMEQPKKKVKRECTAVQLERLAKGRETLALKNAERKKQREELQLIEKRILEVENESTELKKKVLEERLKETETVNAKLKQAAQPPVAKEPEEDDTPIQKQVRQPQIKPTPSVVTTSKYVFC